MILDKENQLADSQAITTTLKSTNTLDLGPESWRGNSLGATHLNLVFTINETFDTGGEAGVLRVDVRSSESEDMSSPIVHQKSADIPEAALVAGADMEQYLGGLSVPWPARRYVDVLFTVVSGGPFTAGMISVNMTPGLQTNG